MRLDTAIVGSVFKDEVQAARLRAEAAFGASEVSPFLEQLDGQATALEIGCGTGLLLSELAKRFDAISFTGVEPIGPGFAQFADSLDAIEKAHVNIAFIRKRIEDVSSNRKFDLIFSINVFEHLDDWRRAMDICISMLKPGGKLVILCPNYNIPYESHFSLPVVFGKSFTQKIFAGTIRKIEEKLDAQGLWQSLNFIKASQIKRFCTQKGYGCDFDRAIMGRMLDRLEVDPEFRERQNTLARIAVLANRLGAGRLFEYLPERFGAYMKIVVKSAG
tara:strand:- start:496 stop:1320 length:825 start_codon:yes stop_codon:yes gene_type:complete